MSRADRITPLSKQPEIYSDFLINFDRHPLSGDLAKVSNAEAIKQSIRNLLLTNYGERLFNPIIGSNVYKSLFEPLDGFTIQDIKQAITDTLYFHEKRIEVVAVEVNANPNDENSLTATIVFSIINTGSTETLNLVLRRVR